MFNSDMRISKRGYARNTLSPSYAIPPLERSISPPNIYGCRKSARVSSDGGSACSRQSSRY
eukprot:1195235-Prorocentrum_minimum.AAC.2